MSHQSVRYLQKAVGSSFQDPSTSKDIASQATGGPKSLPPKIFGFSTDALAKKNNVASTTKAEREVKEALDELLVDRAEVNIYIEDPKDTKKEAKIALAECSLINAKACEAIVYENGKHWEKPYPWHYKSFPTRMANETALQTNQKDTDFKNLQNLVPKGLGNFYAEMMDVCYYFHLFESRPPENPL
ncbi:Hypothetical predicted protein [Olea europaea subsp. europaea]|uniref:Uncharacterized protein n=1 Tax=Olea europaea subsp. europaea TaxID=158383 RepID=A0A8S0TQN3_OLEEU|nr:Hypothetical predicted protein [Olea europaea subsp. europaea]